MNSNHRLNSQNIASRLNRALNSNSFIASFAIVFLLLTIAAPVFLLIQMHIDLEMSALLWQAVAAIATSAACVIALYLGLQEQMHRRKEQQEENDLLTIIISEDLKGLLPVLGHMAQIYSVLRSAEQSFNIVKFQSCASMLKDAAQRIEMPSYKEAFALTSKLCDEKKLAVLHIYTSLPRLKRRSLKLKPEHLGAKSGNYPDSALAIKDDISKIAFYAKVFLPDQSKHYWRCLKSYANEYTPEEKSFHDLTQ